MLTSMEVEEYIKEKGGGDKIMHGYFNGGRGEGLG